MWLYGRFFMMTVLLLFAIHGMWTGGWGMFVGFFVATFFVVGGDALFGDDTSEPTYRQTWILNAQLYSNLPLLWIITLGYAWHLAPGDWLGAAAFVERLGGPDLMAYKAANSWVHYLGGALSLGMMFGGVGTVVGHELTHRTWSKPALIVGRWLLALTSDASFAIEHVYGHHKNVATREDPATARRGENAWFFVLRSSLQSYLHAWKIEAERLARKGQSVWSWHNRMHRGNLMTLAYAAVFFAAAGWLGVAAFFAISLYGKAYLEFVNYVEHYGIVRVPDAPVEPRHSWNCNKRISSYLLYNLTRHSHHHAMGEKPFWELKAYSDTPMLPFGYLTAIIVAGVPPLWNRIMIPRVLDWDYCFAGDAERPLIAAANRASGHPMFEADAEGRGRPLGGAATGRDASAPAPAAQHTGATA